MLVPKIDDIQLQPNPIGPLSQRLRITGERLFNSKKEKECIMIIGDAVIPSANYDPKTPKEIAFDLPASLKKGEYIVRVRVNGVEGLAEDTLIIK
jgi:hypothetical protein